jgi:hypothetical protein
MNVQGSPESYKVALFICGLKVPVTLYPLTVTTVTMLHGQGRYKHKTATRPLN